MELEPRPEPSIDAFYAGGPKSFQEAFPPACIRSHWDPTLVSQYILPSQPIGTLAFDPRPSVRICTSYYTTSQAAGSLPYKQEVTPTIPSEFLGGSKRPVESTVKAVPPGAAAGRGASYTEYAQSIDKEADLYRLNEPLTRCKERRYRPEHAPADAINTLPYVSNEYELAPYAMHVNKKAGCRDKDDEEAWNRSSRLFFNHTRQDRYTGFPVHGPLKC